MRLVLHYRGPLKANGSPSHKFQIRRAVHVQLKTLWSQPPLADMPSLIEERRDDTYCFLRPLDPFVFVPLVTAEADTIAELDIALLRPEPPGRLITQGGDIDNRLKTLFDALAMPRLANALLSSERPTDDEIPFFCLLEDDNLVTAVNVRTEQLLEPTADPNIVEATIRVRTRVTRQLWDNDIFG